MDTFWATGRERKVADFLIDFRFPGRILTDKVEMIEVLQYK